MKDDKKIKTEKIVLNGLVIAGIVLTLLAVLASPFIIVAIIKAGEYLDSDQRFGLCLRRAVSGGTH